MTARRRLAASLALTGFLLVAGNLAIHVLARGSVPRQLLARIADGPPASVVGIGNSVIESGFDPGVFTDASGGRSALNAGLGATGPVQHLLIAHAVLRGRPEVTDLVYGFFGFMLTDPSREPWWGIRGNNALVFQTDTGLAARHLAPTAVGRMAFRLAGMIPMFVEREALWARVERWRRRLGGLGMPPVESNRFGRVADFVDLAGADPAVHRAEAAARVRGEVSLAPAVRELLDAAAARGVRVWLVAMPLAPGHPAAASSPEWQGYMELLRRRVESSGAHLVDAAGWIDDPGLFVDSVHLSPEGAREFSLRLAGAMGAQGGGG